MDTVEEKKNALVKPISSTVSTSLAISCLSAPANLKSVHGILEQNNAVQE